MGQGLRDYMNQTLLDRILTAFRGAAGAALYLVDADGGVLAQTEEGDERDAECIRRLAAAAGSEITWDGAEGGPEGASLAVTAGKGCPASIVAWPFSTGKREKDGSGLKLRRVHPVAAPLVSKARLAQTLIQLRDTLAALCEDGAGPSGRPGHDRLVNHSTDAMVRMSTGGKCLYISPACHRLFGYTSDELAGQNLIGFFHKEDAQRFLRSGVMHRLAQKKPATFSFRFRRKDGSYLWVEATGQAITGADGAVLEISASIRDISERKAAEEALKSSEKRYRDLFETMTEGVALHEIVYDEAGRAVDYVVNAVNPAFAAQTSIDPAKAVGARASALYGEEKPPYLNRYAQTAETGKPQCFDAFFEPLGKHFRISVFSPERGKFTCVFEDITERKRTEEALRRSEEQYRLLADHSTDVIMKLTMQGMCTYASPACTRVFGYEPEEMVGMHLFNMDDPENPFARSIRENAVQNGQLSFIFPRRARRKDGGEIWIEVSGRIIQDGEGRHVEIQTTTRDITDRKRAEADIRAYQEQLGMLMKNLDAIILHLDPEGTYTLVEGRGLEKIGRTAADYIGKSIYCLHGNDPELLSAYEQAAGGRRAALDVNINGVLLEEVYAPSVGVDGRQNGVICLAVDITERKLAEKNLFAEKERLRITLQSIGDGVIATDSEGMVLLMNGVAEELTGWNSREAMGEPFVDVFDIYNEMTGEKCANPVERVLSTGNIVGIANHTALRSRDGSVRSISDSAAPILDAEKNILGVILVFRDVTDEKKKESEITYLSYHDRLTGLYNRAFLEEETRRLDTVRQLPISVIMGDVNGLKLTNDVFGHTEGDNLLICIAGILRECCRNEDIVARVGGDEFCILLPKTSYATASDICRRIYARCDKEDYSLPGGGAKLSISLGFATKTAAQESIASITKAAEDSMYRRKLLESRSQHSFLISSIRTTLFEKSCETEQHAQRLIAHSKAVAMALNLPEDQINDIELFALLHDIGKIAIDSHILTKQDKLTDEEWAEMKRHPEIGFRIAQASPDLAHIAEYILCHHERWDGTGYPQGLKGTAIPLLARILLVVDAYDAMTQDRVYRRAMTREEACAELLTHAGAQFDPNIVWVFMEWLEDDDRTA